MEKKENKGQKKQEEPFPGKKDRQEAVTFDEFKKCDLRVAEIITAEKVVKSDRLLKLRLKAPEERTVVAGIAEHYSPEDLPGKKVIIVANLQPAKIMGIYSEGMVLAARDEEKLFLPEISEAVSPGSRIA